MGRPTPYTDYVKHYVEENRLGDRVLMLHNVPNADLPSIYQMAEACVYPSRYEGFGIPVIEAIQSGLPVVACKGSWSRGSRGERFSLCCSRRVVGMSEAVKTVLKGAPGGRDLRVARAQKYISRFEAADVASQVLNLYQSLVED